MHKYFRRRFRVSVILKEKNEMNIVLVVFDSLRKDCVGGYNSSPSWGRVKTPYLDALANEALVMTRVFPESLATLPARRALYTGERVYPFVNSDFRHLKGDFVLDNIGPGWGPIPEDQDTISELLQKSGYRTCLTSSVNHMFKPSKNFWRGFDQWDFVRGKEMDPYRSGPLPTQEEINYWLPPNMPNDERRVNLVNKGLMNVRELRVNLITKELMNMREFMKYEENSIVAQVMIKASKWLQENQDAKKFFLVVESFDPHEAWFVPKQYRLMYDNSNAHEQVLSLYEDISKMPPEILHRTQANYSGLVSMCDRWFGYLYETMKNLGLLDNTILIVTSDHGHSIGENNYMGKRGYPSTREVFDIPLLIRHPNKIGAGQKSDLLIQHTDISALILDFAKVTPSKIIHGKKFWENSVKNGKPIRDHVTVGWGTTMTVINDEWWLNCKISGRGAFLYDLNKDPLLKKNVAEEHQNVVDYLFSKGVDDAGGSFPDYLLQLEREGMDSPGCSPLASRSSYQK